MCYCWEKDENGKVIGICTDMKEIARRIHDPNYMPELKALRHKMSVEMAAKRKDEYSSLPPERKAELQQEWIRIIKKGKL